MIKYKHPLHYKGIPEYESIQKMFKIRVERYCLKCNKFMGKEHDFKECLKPKKFIIDNSKCPFGYAIVGNCEKVKMESEEK